MKTKALLAVSLVANGLLLAAAVYVARQGSGELSSLAPLVVCVPHPGPEAVGKPVASAVSATNPVASFDWRRVESEDYKQYVTRLRGIGCTEKAIGDLVVADVNTLFRMRANGRVSSINEFRP